MQDSFKDHAQGLTSPAADASPIVPDDTADLQYATRAIYVGMAGDATVQMTSGEQITFYGLAAGAIYPLRCRRVLATGTSAGGLIALW
ncbi:MAG: hypothetical protein ACK5IB_01455 [Qingshengfaniella sp.]